MIDTSCHMLKMNETRSLFGFAGALMRSLSLHPLSSVYVATVSVCRAQAVYTRDGKINFMNPV